MHHVTLSCSWKQKILHFHLLLLYLGCVGSKYSLVMTYVPLNICLFLFKNIIIFNKLCTISGGHKFIDACI